MTHKIDDTPREAPWHGIDFPNFTPRPVHFNTIFPPAEEAFDKCYREAMEIINSFETQRRKSGYSFTLRKWLDPVINRDHAEVINSSNNEEEQL